MGGRFAGTGGRFQRNEWPVYRNSSKTTSLATLDIFRQSLSHKERLAAAITCCQLEPERKEEKGFAKQEEVYA